jgi:serine protease Do
MEIRNKIKRRGHPITGKLLSGLALAITLSLAGVGTLRAQNAPEPPAPLESPQSFILNDGSVHLGVTLNDVTVEKAQELKLPGEAGALVTSVQKDSAAAKAGIETGDAIIEFDGIRVRSSAELRRLIRETPAGRTVAIKIVRDKKTRVLSATLEASENGFSFGYDGPEIRIPPINVPEIHIPPMDIGGRRAALDISGDDLTPQLAEFFGVKQGHGVLVAEVTAGGSGDKAGLKAGDVIVQVDGKDISGVRELRTALNSNFTGETRKVTLTIVRDHHEKTVQAELTRSPAGEKRTFSTSLSGGNEQLEQIQQQARKQADEFRARVQDEVLKEKEYLGSEWQRQFQEQMRALKDELQKMKDAHLALNKGSEI